MIQKSISLNYVDQGNVQNTGCRMERRTPKGAEVLINIGLQWYLAHKKLPPPFGRHSLGIFLL